MVSLFIREYEPHTQNEWINIFGIEKGAVIEILRILKYDGILHKSKSDKLVDLGLSEDASTIYDIDPEDKESKYYFKFVGVIVIKGCVIKCFPKYITSNNPVSEFKQIIKVLQKYDAKKEYLFEYSGLEHIRRSDSLGFMITLLWDYFDYGLYNNTETVFELNGDGIISWDRTIPQSLALVKNNKPYYVDVITKRTAFKEEDYFRLLHEYVLTKCSRQLNELGLLDIFDISEVDLTDSVQDDFGDLDYILERIDREINVQFSSRKQFLLAAMRCFFDKNIDLDNNPVGYFLGTTAFYDVWEKVCQSVFVSQFEMPFNNIFKDVPEPYIGLDSFKSIIEHPKWKPIDKESIEFEHTLKPDYVAMINNTFLILDAKYYTPMVNGKGFPGVEAIIKQYMYELAYNRFLKFRSNCKVVNCFVFPSEKDFVESEGFLYMEICKTINDGLSDILIRKLPAKYLYECYLSNKSLDYNYLNV